MISKRAVCFEAASKKGNLCDTSVNGDSQMDRFAKSLAKMEKCLRNAPMTTTEEA